MGCAVSTAAVAEQGNSKRNITSSSHSQQRGPNRASSPFAASASAAQVISSARASSPRHGTTQVQVQPARVASTDRKEEGQGAPADPMVQRSDRCPAAASTAPECALSSPRSLTAIVPGEQTNSAGGGGGGQHSDKSMVDADGNHITPSLHTRRLIDIPQQQPSPSCDVGDSAASSSSSSTVAAAPASSPAASIAVPPSHLPPRRPASRAAEPSSSYLAPLGACEEMKEEIAAAMPMLPGGVPGGVPGGGGGSERVSRVNSSHWVERRPQTSSTLSIRTNQRGGAALKNTSGSAGHSPSAAMARNHIHFGRSSGTSSNSSGSSSTHNLLRLSGNSGLKVAPVSIPSPGPDSFDANPHTASLSTTPNRIHRLSPNSAVRSLRQRAHTIGHPTMSSPGATNTNTGLASPVTKSALLPLSNNVSPAAGAGGGNSTPTPTPHTPIAGQTLDNPSPNNSSTPAPGVGDARTRASSSFVSGSRGGARDLGMALDASIELSTGGAMSTLDGGTQSQTHRKHSEWQGSVTIAPSADGRISPSISAMNGMASGNHTMMHTYTGFGGSLALGSVGGGAEISRTGAASSIIGHQTVLSHTRAPHAMGGLIDVADTLEEEARQARIELEKERKLAAKLTAEARVRQKLHPMDSLYDRSQVINLSSYGYAHHTTRTYRPQSVLHSYAASYHRAAGADSPDPTLMGEVEGEAELTIMGDGVEDEDGDELELYATEDAVSTMDIASRTTRVKTAGGGGGAHSSVRTSRLGTTLSRTGGGGDQWGQVSRIAAASPAVNGVTSSIAHRFSVTRSYMERDEKELEDSWIGSGNDAAGRDGDGDGDHVHFSVKDNPLDMSIASPVGVHHSRVPSSSLSMGLTPMSAGVNDTPIANRPSTAATSP